MFSDLVGSIYDAGIGAAGWSESFELVGRFVPACMVNLFAEDTAPRSVSRFFTWGDDPAYTAAYVETFAPLNPLFPAGLFFPVGEVYSSSDIMPQEELRGYRFYREYLEPQGYVDFIACNLDRSATGCTIFTAVRHRDQGLADPASRARMALLVPHVRRAAAIARALEHSAVALDNLSAATDSLAAGIVLLGQDGLIAHANASALGMLEDGKVVRAERGRITFVDPSARTAIAGALQNATERPAGASGLSLPLRSAAGGEWVCHLLPLSRSGRQRVGRSASAAMVLFLQPASAALQGAAEAVFNRYGLTAAELRVLVALGSGVSVAGVAEALGIGEATVRTHLLRLYAKTGVSGQANLIRLLAAYSGPGGRPAPA